MFEIRGFKIYLVNDSNEYVIAIMNVIIDERKENAMTFNKVLLSWIVILIITTSIYLFWQLGISMMYLTSLF